MTTQQAQLHMARRPGYDNIAALPLAASSPSHDAQAWRLLEVCSSGHKAPVNTYQAALCLSC